MSSWALISKDRARTILIFIAEKIRPFRPHGFAFAVITLAGLAVLTWFRGFLLYHWDTIFPFNPTIMIQAFYWPWSDLISTGTPVLGNVSLPYFALAYMLESVLGLSALGSQISIYYLLFIIGGASMYLFFVGQSGAFSTLSRKLRFGAVASSLVYMFNPYAMVYIWMVFSQEAYLYSTLPLLLLLFQRGLEKSARGVIDWKVITVLAGVTLFATPALGIPAFSIPVLIGFAMFYLLWLLPRDHMGRWKDSIRFVSLVGLSLFCISLWWIYPTIFLYGTQLTRASGASQGSGIPDLISNSVHTNYFNVFRLLGMFPLYNSMRYPHYDFAWMYQDFFPMMLISILVPVIAFLGLIQRRSIVQQHSRLFAALCIVGVVPLSTGLQPPFGGLFEWGALNIPAFSVLFRDPYQKFGFWLPFGYSFLIGAWLSSLGGRGTRGVKRNGSRFLLARRKWSHGRVVFSGIALILITSVYVWPM